jgi:hypothetical protein
MCRGRGGSAPCAQAPVWLSVSRSVADPDHFDADPDRDPDTCSNYEPPQLQNVDFDAFTDPDTALDFNADSDPAFENDAD